MRGGGERSVWRTLFYDGGGSPQCGSTLRQNKSRMSPSPFTTAARACSPSLLPRFRAGRSRERPVIMDWRSASRRTWRDKPTRLTYGPHGNTKRRTWRPQLAKLHGGPQGDRSDAHGVSACEAVSFPAWGYTRNSEVRSDAQCRSSLRSCSRFIPHEDSCGAIWREATHSRIFSCLL